MAQPTLTPRAFGQKWRDNETKEKAASQEHFIDLIEFVRALSGRGVREEILGTRVVF